MVDLITRLQVCAQFDPDQAEAIEVIQSQAARIAELEAALQEIVKRTRHAHPMSYVGDYYRIANDALAGGKDE